MLERRAFLGAASLLASSLALSGCVGGDVEPTKTPKTGEDTGIQRQPIDVLPEGGQWMTLSCWQSCGGRCLNKGYVVDGVIIRQKTDDTHDDSQDYPQQRSCPRGKTLSSTWLGEDRIKYPMKRKHWQPGGVDYHPELRGQDEWERISWDEAVGYVADEVKRVFEQFGSRSFLGVSWDGLPYASYLGGSVGIMATGSRGSARLAPAHLGAEHDGCDVKRGQANDRFDLMYNAENVVLYSFNPAWNAMGSPMWHFMKAKENGATFTVVGPDYNMTASMLEADWIPVRPGTDTAFLLAVAYEMLRLDEEGGNVVDWDFLHKYTVGFDAESMPANAASAENFLGYVKGEYDGVPKTPEWATKICGTPVEAITKFATLLSKENKVMTFNAFGCMRHTATENLEQLMIAVNSMGGHYGKPGQCWGGYYFDGGSDAPCNLILTGSSGVDEAKEKLGIAPKKMLGEPCDDVVSAAQVWDAILNKKYHFTGDIRNDAPESACEERDLDVRFMDFGTWSAMRSYPDTVKAVRALREGGIECVVGRGILPKLDIQFCDIVVPVISDLEKEAILETGEGGREIVYHYDKVCDPLYEARTNREFESAILTALGEDPAGMYPLSEEQKLYNIMAGTTVICDDGVTYEPLLTITQEDIDAMGVEGQPQQGRITLQEFKEKGVYQVERKQGDNFGFIAYKDFVDDPVAHPLATDSGKFEIYCQYKADNVNRIGLNDTPIKPYANYFVPRRGYQETFANWEAKEKGAYPLQAYTPHYMRRAHTCYDNMTWTQEAFRNPVFMSVEDAEARGIKAGDTVRCFNDFGSMLRIAQPMQGYMPGVVGIPHGVHSVFDESDPENIIDRGGSEQMLSDGLQSNYFPQVDGYNSLLIEIEKYDGEPLVEDFERGPFLAAGIDDEGTAAYVVPGADNGQEA